MRISKLHPLLTSLSALCGALEGVSATTTSQPDISITTFFTTIHTTTTITSTNLNEISPSPTSTCLIPLQAPNQPAPTKIPNLPSPDLGFTFGNAIIRNNCGYPIFVRSVGAHYLNGPRNKTTGFGSPEDDCFHSIAPGSYFIEPFRASAGCMYHGEPIYCVDEDRLAGQAVSFKISFNLNYSAPITQFEYALYQNPILGDAFQKLIYDVSLLDCAQPADSIAVDDFNASAAMHARKLAECPGYAGGVAVSFDADPHGDNCPPIFCDGRDKCYLIYTWDRTRKQEATFVCEREYRGNMTLDLCATRGDVGEQVEAFEAWARTATNEVLLLARTKTESSAGSVTLYRSTSESLAVGSGLSTPVGWSTSTLSKAPLPAFVK